MKRAFAGAATCLALLGIAPDAVHACSWPANSFEVHDSPANGVVTMSSYCPTQAGVDCPALPSVVRLVDSTTGESLQATQISMDHGESSSLWAFKPESPLQPGHTYSLDVDDPYPDAAEDDIKLAFVALPNSDVSAQYVTWTATLSATETDSETITCPMRSNNSCNFGEIAPEEIVTRKHHAATLLLRPVYGDSQSMNSRLGLQFTTRMAFYAQGDPAPASGDLYWATNLAPYEVFLETANAYCYRAEVTRLIDGTMATVEGCVENDLGVELGPYDVPAEKIIQRLPSCYGAPEGWEAEWCAAVEERCVPAPEREDCQDYATTCAMLPPDAGVDAADAGTPSEDAGLWVEPDAGVQVEDARFGVDWAPTTSDANAPTQVRRVSSGCSVGAAGSRSWLPALLVFAALGLVRRRRR